MILIYEYKNKFKQFNRRMAVYLDVVLAELLSSAVDS